MSNARKFLLIIAFVVVVIIAGNAVSRRVLDNTQNSDGTIAFTDTYTLENSLSEDLFVVADVALVPANTQVEGDAALVGRTRASLEGTVVGDVVVMGGELALGEAAQVSGHAAFIGNHVTLAGTVDGSLSVVADTLTILPGAQLPDNPELCASNVIDERSDSPPLANCGAEELAGWQSLRDGTFLSTTISAGGMTSEGLLLSIGFTLAMTALSGVVVTVFPRAFSYMTQAVRQIPGRMARVGCLSLLLVPGTGAVLLLALALLPPLGLVLLPVTCLLSIPLALCFVAGWMTMALLLGDVVLHRLARRTSPPIMTVMVGSFLLLVLWMLATSLPYGTVLGPGLTLLIGMVGLGAVLVTRLGTRSPTRRHFVQG